jgi:nucleotide-binding universal stress UspA family protein
MNALRKILVPIDFSEDSVDGLSYAVSLAQKTQAELLALHVTQKKETDSFLNFLAMMEGCPMLNAPAPIPVDRLLGEKALDLYRFIEKVVRNPRRVKIRRKVTLGNQAERILAVVKEERIDLVVLPIPKRPFFPYLSARGKLLRILSRLPCPVLLKPSPDEPWPTSGILGPSIFAR